MAIKNVEPNQIIATALGGTKSLVYVRDGGERGPIVRARDEATGRTQRETPLDSVLAHSQFAWEFMADIRFDPPPGVEEPPVLDDEDEAILDAIWDAKGKGEAPS